MKLRMLLIGCIVFSQLSAEELRGTVINVLDGNTIEVTCMDNETYKVLLHGIDSPEPGQNYADQAKKFLEDLLLKKAVIITIQGKDRQGNRLGIITLDGTSDPRRELVKAGLAWTSGPDPELEALKLSAREKGLGLWQDENPMPPWLYRRQQTMLQAKSS